MWLVDDSVMDRLLGNDYSEVVALKQLYKNLSIRKLFKYQNEYKSYDGFRKFYNNKLSKILNDISYLDDNKFVCRLLKRLFRFHESR